jgi:hypothetical protein
VRVLERLVAACDGRLDVEAVLVRPAGADERWEQTDLARAVAAIPGVRTTVDAGGSVARRFGARTSGQVVLYDPAGHLVFGGGITPSRGHEGDSAGGDAVVAAVRSTTVARAGAAAAAVTPVYGCALDGPAAQMLSAPFTEHAK